MEKKPEKKTDFSRPDLPECRDYDNKEARKWMLDGLSGFPLCFKKDGDFIEIAHMAPEYQCIKTYKYGRNGATCKIEIWDIPGFDEISKIYFFEDESGRKASLDREIVFKLAEESRARKSRPRSRDNNEFGVPDFDGGNGEIDIRGNPDHHSELAFALNSIKKTYKFGRFDDSPELYALSEPTPKFGWLFLVEYNMIYYWHKDWKSAQFQARNLKDRQYVINNMLGGN
jgi:hypothetical protein